MRTMPTEIQKIEFCWMNLIVDLNHDVHEWILFAGIGSLLLITSVMLSDFSMVMVCDLLARRVGRMNLSCGFLSIVRLRICVNYYIAASSH